VLNFFQQIWQWRIRIMKKWNVAKDESMKNEYGSISIIKNLNCSGLDILLRGVIWIAGSIFRLSKRLELCRLVYIYLINIMTLGNLLSLGLCSGIIFHISIRIKVKRSWGNRPVYQNLEYGDATEWCTRSNVIDSAISMLKFPFKLTKDQIEACLCHLSIRIAVVSYRTSWLYQDWRVSFYTD